MGQMTPGNLTGQVGGTLELVRVISIVLAIGAGCGGSDGPDLSGLPACGTSSLLQVSPMGLGDLREIAPLGNLAPPSHTFPADHVYFYPTIGAAVPVISPGAIRSGSPRPCATPSRGWSSLRRPDSPELPRLERVIRCSSCSWWSQSSRSGR